MQRGFQTERRALGFVSFIHSSWSRDGAGGGTGSGLDTTYSYSATTGKLITVDYEDSNTAEIAYTYDRLGRQATVTDATGTRSYDTLGRGSGYSLQASGGTSSVSSATYGYDSSGRLATVTDPANRLSTATYAEQSEVPPAGETGTVGGTITIDFAYDLRIDGVRESTGSEYQAKK